MLEVRQPFRLQVRLSKCGSDGRSRRQAGTGPTVDDCDLAKERHSMTVRRMREWLTGSKNPLPGLEERDGDLLPPGGSGSPGGRRSTKGLTGTKLPAHAWPRIPAVVTESRRSRRDPGSVARICAMCLPAPRVHLDGHGDHSRSCAQQWLAMLPTSWRKQT